MATTTSTTTTASTSKTIYTTQSGIRQNTNTFQSVDLFRNMLTLDNGNIGQYNFDVGGYGFFVWVNLPTFMQLTQPDLVTKFKNLTEKGHTSFDGINDMSVNTEDITGGIAGNTFKQVTNLKYDFDTFTIKCYEMQGSPLRETLTSWLYGIRDPGNGYANYNGIINTIDGGYNAKNHTGELMYVRTDPSGSYNGIEYACLIANIIPTKIPMSHLNLTHGDHPVTTFDLEFSGTKYESKWINEKAVQIVKARAALTKCYEFVPANTALYKV